MKTFFAVRVLMGIGNHKTTTRRTGRKVNVDKIARLISDGNFVVEPAAILLSKPITPFK